MVVFSFLPFLATVAQLLGWAAMGRGRGRILEAVAGEGATVGSGKGMGVGVSGRGVHQQKDQPAPCCVLPSLCAGRCGRI